MMEGNVLNRHSQYRLSGTNFCLRSSARVVQAKTWLTQSTMGNISLSLYNITKTGKAPNEWQEARVSINSEEKYFKNISSSLAANHIIKKRKDEIHYNDASCDHKTLSYCPKLASTRFFLDDDLSLLALDRKLERALLVQADPVKTHNNIYTFFY